VPAGTRLSKAFVPDLHALDAAADLGVVDQGAGVAIAGPGKGDGFAGKRTK